MLSGRELEWWILGILENIIYLTPEVMGDAFRGRTY